MDHRFHEDFLLVNETGKMLYHKYAEHIPIIDYHCHLSPQEIYENREFEDLGEMWLRGDHYKWRCMRTFGIDEAYITGNASYFEKFMAFAEILPQLIGNPIYIWCALELKRYFDIDEPLSKKNAQSIYDKTKKIIREKHITRRWCIEHSNVKLIATTEDPIDDLQWHTAMNRDEMRVRVISAFRPDQAMFCTSESFQTYIGTLSHKAQMPICCFRDMISALERRLQYFKKITGTTVTDNGIPALEWIDYTEEEIEIIFRKALAQEHLTHEEEQKYTSCFLYEMAKVYHRNHCVMQLHIGTYLDANTSKVIEIGKSTGFDCIDDSTQVTSVGQLLNRLTGHNVLPKTLLYPLDGTKIEAWAVLAAGFCEGGIRSKVQLAAPWWFNDQIYGIRRQFESCACLYPIALSVGMLTDSRSFLSYPRHELYRRVLCDYLGMLVERGEYFSEESELQEIIENICFNNANEYFGFNLIT